jgi:hypothetical protein
MRHSQILLLNLGKNGKNYPLQVHRSRNGMRFYIKTRNENLGGKEFGGQKIFFIFFFAEIFFAKFFAKGLPTQSAILRFPKLIKSHNFPKKTDQNNGHFSPSRIFQI